MEIIEFIIRLVKERFGDEYAIILIFIFIVPVLIYKFFINSENIIKGMTSWKMHKLRFYKDIYKELDLFFSNNKYKKDLIKEIIENKIEDEIFYKLTNYKINKRKRDYIIKTLSQNTRIILLNFSFQLQSILI